MDKIRPLLPFLFLLFAAVFVIVLLFPTAHEHGGLRVPMDNRQAMDASRALLDRMKIDISSMNPEAQLLEDRASMNRIQQLLGFRRSQNIIGDSLYGYLWKIRWTHDKEININLKDESEEKQAERIASLLRGDISVTFDMRGRLRAFQRSVDDSVRLASLSIDSARSVALSFVRTYTEIQSIDDTTAPSAVKTTELPARTDHQFTWHIPSTDFEQDRTVRVSLAGSLLSSYEIQTPKLAEDVWDTVRRILSTAMIFAIVALGVMMIIMTIRRLRSYEIGFRMAMIIGGITALLFNIEIFLSYQNRMTWEMLIPLLVTPIFTGGAMVLLWAIAEATAREVWKEKLITLDLITHGHFFHSRIGQGTIRGISLGAATCAAQLLLITVADSLTPLWVKYGQSDGIRLFTVATPSVYALGHSLFSTVFPFAFFAVFFLSFLRKYVRSSIVLIGLSATAMALVLSTGVSPTPISVAVYAMASAIALWSFVRYDTLTAFLAFVTSAAAENIGTLWVSGNPGYVISAEVASGFFMILLIASIVTLYRKSEVTDFEQIIPAFARFISERQRLQQELEIARAVQMSFLPKRTPEQYPLDIASRCAPAQEVGGDYYDFIELSRTRLGIAVGDVSGKGTQAAFFMTLTKGFLRALANVSNSPSTILTQVNKLFYESVDRGMFISMVYGVFDVKDQTLTLSRAGHNPVIMRKRQAKDVEIVNPTGIALGLDPGETFAKSIEEEVISFQSGDLFVFYTDGFPEAMNKKKEEFGEAQLAATVEKNASGTAVEIMEGIFRDVKAFTGNAQQHDDMTIVVVKVGNIG